MTEKTKIMKKTKEQQSNWSTFKKTGSNIHERAERDRREQLTQQSPWFLNNSFFFYDGK